MSSAISVQPHSTFFQVTRNYLLFDTGLKRFVIKPTLRILDWKELIQGRLSPELKEVRTLFSRVSLASSWIDFPRKVMRLTKATGELGSALASGPAMQIADRSARVFKKSTSITGLATGAILVASEAQWLGLSVDQLALVNRVGILSSASSLIKVFFEFPKVFQQFSDAAQGVFPVRLACLNLGMKICKLASAFFSLVAFAYGANLYLKIILLSSSTLSLSISISRFFYRNFYIENY